MKYDEEQGKGCLLIGGFLFGIMVISTIYGFIVGGKSFLSSFLNENLEGTNILTLRISFIIFIVAVGIFIYNTVSKK